MSRTLRSEVSENFRYRSSQNNEMNVVLQHNKANSWNTKHSLALWKLSESSLHLPSVSFRRCHLHLIKLLYKLKILCSVCYASSLVFGDEILLGTAIPRFHMNFNHSNHNQCDQNRLLWNRMGRFTWLNSSLDVVEQFKCVSTLHMMI